MTASWEQTTLPAILSSYNLADIYNADEFGLFYQALPEKSLHLKSEKCVGGKHSKIRLNVSFVCNLGLGLSYPCLYHLAAHFYINQYRRHKAISCCKFRSGIF